MWKAVRRTRLILSPLRDRRLTPLVFGPFPLLGFGDAIERTRAARFSGQGSRIRDEIVEFSWLLSGGSYGGSYLSHRGDRLLPGPFSPWDRRLTPVGLRSFPLLDCEDRADVSRALESRGWESRTRGRGRTAFWVRGRPSGSIGSAWESGCAYSGSGP